jgi:hypothetical protein
VSNPELINAVDLDQWSGTLAAQTTLPILVRRLVLATTPVSEITMRAREGALFPGWDGIVRSDATDPHVPRGTSGWELGTSHDPRGKAQSDIHSRTTDPLGLDPKTTTFVAVTSRLWRDRDDWLKVRREEKTWADVRALDADDLVTWLERAPSVYLWISEQLGREPRDVRTPDAWWDRWIRQTRVVLPRDFLLAGRDSVVARILDALGQAPRPITVVGPSREEALAIVCASLLGDGDGDEVDELRARAVIVSAPGAWDRLVDSDNPLVLIPNFEDADIMAALSRGHHVVIPLGRDARHDEGHILIPLLDRAVAAEAILDEAAGTTREVANRRAAHAHRNLLSVRRTLAANLRFARPPWSEGEQGRHLAPMILAGSWSDDLEGDRAAIGTLTGRAYAEVEGDLAAWAAQDDAPVTRIGQAWRIVSRGRLGPGLPADHEDHVDRVPRRRRASPRRARSRARSPR